MRSSTGPAATPVSLSSSSRLLVPGKLGVPAAYPEMVGVSGREFNQLYALVSASKQFFLGLMALSEIVFGTVPCYWYALP